MRPRRNWPVQAAAAAAGAALGIAAITGGALLLYAAEGFLTSAGFLVAAVLVGTGAGVWSGAPTPAEGSPRPTGRWMFAILAFVLASFAASAWLRVPALQSAPLAGPLGMVLFLAEPGYAVGALLAALSAGATDRRGLAVPALLGAGAGSLLAAAVLIPMLPPGPVFFGAALLLVGAGTLELAMGRGTEEAMTGGVVLVTGAGRRGQVGHAVAEAFLQHGSRVVLCDRSEAVVTLAEELGDSAAGVAADLSTEAGAAAAVEAATSRWGRLDVVVNAVGGLRVIKPLAETTPEEWTAEVERNATTAFLVSRAALPALRESRGSIINFASPAVDRPAAGLGAYSAGKAGVAALTRALAVEEKGKGVRVNAVAPGLVDTESNRASAGEGAAFVSMEAITEAVRFLASARGVSGEILKVTGTERGGEAG